MRSISEDIHAVVERNTDRIIVLAQELVRIESENHPPLGNERAVQERIARFWTGCGIEHDMFLPANVPGFRTHPAFFDNARDYSDRPVVVAKLPGTGTGRSLMFSGHADVVPVGSDIWRHGPYEAEIDDGKLYGRGALDMKGGIAAAMMAACLLKEMGIRLEGNLYVETVPDEEFASSNGTVAARARGYAADAAVVVEASNLAVVTGQRGFRMAQVSIAGDIVGISLYGGEMINPVQHLVPVLQGIEAFRALRLPVTGEDTVMITKLGAGEFRTDEIFASPRQCRVEVYWQTAPGEDIAAVDRIFEDSIRAACKGDGFFSKYPPVFEYLHRPMPGSAVPADSSIVAESCRAVETVTGKPADVLHGFVPCDMFIFNNYCGIPAVDIGPSGENAHAPDEYVVIEDVIRCVEIYMNLAVNWCGTA